MGSNSLRNIDDDTVPKTEGRFAAFFLLVCVQEAKDVRGRSLRLIPLFNRSRKKAYGNMMTVAVALISILMTTNNLYWTELCISCYIKLDGKRKTKKQSKEHADILHTYPYPQYPDRSYQKVVVMIIWWWSWLDDLVTAKKKMGFLLASRLCRFIRVSCNFSQIWGKLKAGKSKICSRLLVPFTISLRLVVFLPFYFMQKSTRIKMESNVFYNPRFTMKNTQ